MLVTTWQRRIIILAVLSIDAMDSYPSDSNDAIGKAEVVVAVGSVLRPTLPDTDTVSK